MARLVSATLVVGFTVTALACAPMVHSLRDDAVPVSRGATWAWGTRPNQDLTYGEEDAGRWRRRYGRRALLQSGQDSLTQRLRGAVAAVMDSMGYRRVDDTASADLLLIVDVDPMPPARPARAPYFASVYFGTIHCLTCLMNPWPFPLYGWDGSWMDVVYTFHGAGSFSYSYPYQTAFWDGFLRDSWYTYGAANQYYGPYPQYTYGYPGWNWWDRSLTAELRDRRTGNVAWRAATTLDVYDQEETSATGARQVASRLLKEMP